MSGCLTKGEAKREGVVAFGVADGTRARGKVKATAEEPTHIRCPHCAFEIDPRQLHRLGCCVKSKKLLGALGIATRSKDATRGSWPYY